MSLFPPEVELSSWMEGEEPEKLATAARNWFGLLARAASWGIVNKDPMECDPVMLDQIAWERNVKRYAGEPERLYRLRVNYAYENGRDAGGINGWKRIFKRLELVRDEHELTLLERMPGQDWDIIGIEVDDSRFPDLQNVLEIIIDEYGRTCRRYRFISRITQPVYLGCTTFDEDHCTMEAATVEKFYVSASSRAGIFDHEQTTTEARAWA